MKLKIKTKFLNSSKKPLPVFTSVSIRTYKRNLKAKIRKRRLTKQLSDLNKYFKEFIDENAKAALDKQKQFKRGQAVFKPGQFQGFNSAGYCIPYFHQNLHIYL